MGDQEDSTLEFQDAVAVDTLTRQAFRIPVHDRKEFNIVAGQQTLNIYDISMGGASISVTTPVEWALNTELAGWCMNLGRHSVPGLEGRVVHSSPAGQGDWMTGIQWLNLPAAQKKNLENLLYELRQELFESEE